MGLISVEEAEAKILSEAEPLGIEERPLQESAGLYLAEEIRALESLPSFDNSAMDGYAVRSWDLSAAGKELPARLKLVGEVAAGSVRNESLLSGQAVQIMTGAAMPPGTDTVVVLEEAKRRDGFVVIDHPVASGRHIRRKGEDVEVGCKVLPRGRKIRPAELALLASLGVNRLKVYRPPRVAILATGSELVAPDEPLRPGTIRDSNRMTLKAYLRPLGMEVVDCGVVPDQPQTIREAFEKASSCDVILSSGGVSVGEHDLVKRILIEDFAFETIFWRVAMKPGKPLLFGRLRERLLFGLPGNPISCAVCFVLFIAPALKKMMGDPNPSPVTWRALLSQDCVIKDPSKTHFITARLELDSTPSKVTPTTHQGSGMLTSMTEGNALMIVPAGVEKLSAGAWVEVIPDV